MYNGLPLTIFLIIRDSMAKNSRCLPSPFCPHFLVMKTHFFFFLRGCTLPPSKRVFSPGLLAAKVAMLSDFGQWDESLSASSNQSPRCVWGVGDGSSSLLPSPPLQHLPSWTVSQSTPYEEWRNELEGARVRMMLWVFSTSPRLLILRCLLCERKKPRTSILFKPVPFGAFVCS